MTEPLVTPTLHDVEQAASRIRGLAVRTPVKRSFAMSEHTGAEVWLKLESVQPTGAFKVRGAANALVRRLEAGTLRGVTTASTGNHGIAVAYVANQLSVPAIVCLSDSVPDERATAIQRVGGRVLRGSDDQSAAIRQATALAEENGYAMVPPFDDPDVISGAGTIGLELCEQTPQMDLVIVPVSGGGLAAGVALAVKTMNPSVRVVGVCADRALAMSASLQAGTPVVVPEVPTVAVSLMGDLGPSNRYTLRLVEEYVDDLVAVTEDDIREAVSAALTEDRLVVEGGSAAVLAYLRTQAESLRGQRISAVITGDNLFDGALRSAAGAMDSWLRTEVA